MIGALLLGTSLTLFAPAEPGPKLVVVVYDRERTLITALEHAGGKAITVDDKLHRALANVYRLPPETDLDRVPPQVQGLVAQGLDGCRAAVAMPKDQGGTTIDACAQRLGQSLMFTYYRRLGANGIVTGQLIHDTKRQEIVVQLDLWMFGRSTQVPISKTVPLRGGTERVWDLLKAAMSPDARGIVHSRHLDFPFAPAAKSGYLDAPIDDTGWPRVPARCSAERIPRIELDYPSDLGDALLARWPGKAEPATTCRLRVHTLPAENPVAVVRVPDHRIGLACDVDGRTITVALHPSDPKLLKRLGEGMSYSLCLGAKNDAEAEAEPTALKIVLRGVKGYRTTKQITQVIEKVLGSKRMVSRREGNDTVLTFSPQANVPRIGDKIDGRSIPAGRLKVVSVKGDRLTLELVTAASD